MIAQSSTAPSLKGRLRTAARWFMWAQLVGVIWLGLHQAFYFPVWSAIDEQAHYSFVQIVAEEHRLPVFGKDYVSNEVVAIMDHIYPAKSPKDPKAIGLGGYSYEAFQPPLFYFIAAPTFLVAGDNAFVKVTWLRIFGLALLLSSFYFVCRILRFCLDEDWPFGAIVAITVYAWPALIVRNVTISNCAPEAPLIGLYLMLGLFSENAATWRNRVLASLVLGLLFLTKLTTGYLLYIHLLVAGGAVFDGRDRKKGILQALLLLALPGLVIAPWIVRNVLVHGAPTANAQMIALMMNVVNPSHHVFHLGDVYGPLRDMFIPLPEEWGGAIRQKLGPWDETFVKVLILVPMVIGLLWAVIRREWKLLALALVPVAAATFLVVGTLSRDWPAILARYMFSSLPYFGAFMGVLMVRLGRWPTAIAISLIATLGFAELWRQVFAAGAP